MELTIQHLAAYLPYEIECYSGISPVQKPSEVWKITGLVSSNRFGSKDFQIQAVRSDYKNTINIWPIKLLLRPLSDLTTEIEHNGKRFIPINSLRGLYGWRYLWEEVRPDFSKFNVNALEYGSYKLLLAWHFDVFGLIESNLATPITNPGTKPKN